MKIEVHDECFSQEDIKPIIDDTKFVYGWKSNVNKGSDQGHWNYILTPETSSTYMEPKIVLSAYNAAEQQQFFESPAFAFWKTANELFGERRLCRGYINGYTFGTDTYIHTDSSMKYSSEYKNETVMFYLNSMWDPDWGGETIWLDKKEEIYKSVLPKQGRVVCFDASLRHGARPVTRRFYGLRQVLVFKTVVDRYPESVALNFIYNLTKDISHSNTTFFQHLAGTFGILKAMKMTRDVCFAGLFHSIYDTEFFKAGLNITREDVQELIGTDAEALAYEFCSVRPRKDHILSKTPNQEKLATIEYANILEQSPRIRVDSEYFAKIKKIMEYV